MPIMMNSNQAPLQPADEVLNRLAIAESALLQRQEEIEQTRSELAQLRSAFEFLAKERDEAVAKLSDANSWVFKLAAERKRLELQLERADRELKNVRLKAEAAMSDMSRRLERLAKERDQLFSLSQQAEDSANFSGDMRVRSLESDESLIEKCEDLEERVCSLQLSLDRARQTSLEQAAKIKALVSVVDKASQSERESEDVRKNLEAREAEISILRGNLDDLSVNLGEVQTQAQERLVELVQLTRALATSVDESAEQAEKLQWLVEVSQFIRKTPWWWSILTKDVRRAKLLAGLKRAGLFDGDDYIGRYPDVQAARIDPLDHYILHGLREGRTR